MNARKHQFRITIPYLLAVAVIFGVTGIAWLYLGQVTQNRTDERDAQLRSAVGQIWGSENKQVAPQVRALAVIPPKKATTTDAGNTNATEASTTTPTETEAVPPECQQALPLEPQSTRARAKIDLSHRRKGLLWYSTYRVTFNSTYRIVNASDCSRAATIYVPFPSRGAAYGDFRLEIDGKPLSFSVSKDGAGVLARHQLEANAKHDLRLTYASRGLDSWRYAFGATAGRARDFELKVQTNFAEIDFPDGTLSPTNKQRSGDGWLLTWRFRNLLSDSSLAVAMPHKLNPGPLAAEISKFAPVSLLFFFAILLLVSVVRKIPLHPVHYAMVAAAFFSFHLLLAYLVDQLPLNAAFAIASVASVGLVVSYLRLAIGGRFALLWAGGAQMIYLVLFSLAFFLQGYTGLTITIFSVVTLFVVMQLTGRIDWSKIFNPTPEPPDSTASPSATDSFHKVGESA